MTTLKRNLVCANNFSNYLVGGNLCNAFVMGTLGASDDFFIVAHPAQTEDVYPLITGNFLDSEGNVLLRMVRNELVFNPRNCSKIYGNHIGFGIHDGQGNHILTVSTTWETQTDGTEAYVTRVLGTFYDAKHNIVAIAKEDGSEGCLTLDGIKSAFGHNGDGFGIVHMMDEEEILIAKLMLNTGGKAYETLSGKHVDETVDLDGKILLDVELIRCRISFSSGEFILLRNISMVDCHFSPSGPAASIYELLYEVIVKPDVPPEASSEKLAMKFAKRVKKVRKSVVLTP